MTVNSINTNAAAIQGLASLNAASQQVSDAQNRVSTGLKVASAKDDGATWSIAQTMKSKIAGLQVVNDSLSRGQSILDTASSAASTIADLLKQIQAKVLSYSDSTLDTTSKAALKTDITALIQQIDRTAQSADFDGVNIVDNAAAATTPISLNPPSGPQQYGTFPFGATVGTGPGTISLNMDWNNNYSYQVYLNGQIQYNPGTPLTGNQTFTMHTSGLSSGNAQLWLDSVELVASPPPSPPAVTINSATFTPDASGSPFQLLADAQGGKVSLAQYDLSSAGLGIGNLDWSDPAGMLASVAAASTAVNSAATQMGTDQNLVSGLQKQAAANSTSLQTGVSNLVDADMGQESAKLQAAQTKQQLAAKSLAIANVTPQWILSLFR
jgi:flagellin